MKSAKNIEELVKLEKPHVTTGGTMDERTIDDSFAAMDEAIRANKPSAAGIILASRAAKLAAAAVILVAIGLLMVYRNPPTPQQQPGTVSAAKSPAEMLTAMSLSMAYRRGGIEAMDEQSSKAFEMLESTPAKASIQELLVELNGV